jgi:hypothetical protein
MKNVRALLLIAKAHDDQTGIRAVENNFLQT